jgi:hypothetical protein
MTYNPQGPNHATVTQGDKMTGNLIVFIDLEFLWDQLFNDEHLMSQGKRLRHESVCRVNRDNLGQCVP